MEAYPGGDPALAVVGKGRADVGTAPASLFHTRFFSSGDCLSIVSLAVIFPENHKTVRVEAIQAVWTVLIHEVFRVATDQLVFGFASAMELDVGGSPMHVVHHRLLSKVAMGNYVPLNGLLD